jgi:hypothetical protein
MDIQTVLKTHSQLHPWSCAASAYEFIAKLYEKIGVNDYPLQNVPASQKGGFEFEVFLTSIGLTGCERHLQPSDAMKLFAAETAQQRFPLVSVLAGAGAGSHHWHILADPARNSLITQTTEETLALLDATVAAVPGRDEIHLLTYQYK